jgi:hypothetical protein
MRDLVGVLESTRQICSSLNLLYPDIVGPKYMSPAISVFGSVRLCNTLLKSIFSSRFDEPCSMASLSITKARSVAFSHLASSGKSDTIKYAMTDRTTVARPSRMKIHLRHF